MTPEAPADRVVVGRIGRAHGIKGAVSVAISTDDPETRFAVGATLGTDRDTPATLIVAETRVHHGRWLVNFEGVRDRNEAEALRGTVLSIAAADVGDPGEGAFWDHQLVGLRAVTLAGEEIGVVEEVIHLPGSELLSVREQSGREVLVPFVAEIVPVVDLEAGSLTVDPPEGLLDL